MLSRPEQTCLRPPAAESHSKALSVKIAVFIHALILNRAMPDPGRISQQVLADSALFAQVSAFDPRFHTHSWEFPRINYPPCSLLIPPEWNRSHPERSRFFPVLCALTWVS